MECSFNAPGRACLSRFVQSVSRWSGRRRSAEPVLPLLFQFLEVRQQRAALFSLAHWLRSCEAKVLDGGCAMIQVSIPSMHREEDESGKSKKVRVARLQKANTLQASFPMTHRRCQLSCDVRCVTQPVGRVPVVSAESLGNAKTLLSEIFLMQNI